MDIANEFANYLEDSSFGTVGTTIFVGQMPLDQDGIYIIRSGGSFNNYLPIESTVLDVYVKDAQASTGVTTLENIKRFVHRMHNTTTTNSYIYSMLVLSDVEDLDRDVQRNKIFKISVEITHRATAIIS